MNTITPAQLLAASAIVATRAATVPHLRGLADALVKEAENRARHADAADRDPLVVRDNGTAPAGAGNTGEGLTAQPLSRAGGGGL